MKGRVTAESTCLEHEKATGLEPACGIEVRDSWNRVPSGLACVRAMVFMAVSPQRAASWNPMIALFLGFPAFLQPPTASTRTPTHGDPSVTRWARSNPSHDDAMARARGAAIPGVRQRLPRMAAPSREPGVPWIPSGIHGRCSPDGDTGHASSGTGPRGRIRTHPWDDRGRSKNSTSVTSSATSSTEGISTSFSASPARKSSGCSPSGRASSRPRATCR